MNTASKTAELCVSISRIFIGMKKKFLIGLLFYLHFASFGQQQTNYKVIAYYTGNGEMIRQYPVDKLTHIILSFLSIQNDSLTFRDDRQRLTLQQLVEMKKEYPKLKIMVSIGGWGGCAPCSDLFASPERSSTFAKTTAELFKKYNIDGLDLDWEYPVIEGYPGHKYNGADKDNFTELIKLLRKEMGNSYLLTFAAGGFTDYLEKSIDWDAVMPLVDFVNLMTYDLVNGYSTVTGHHTPLADYLPDQQSTQKCVNWLLNKKVLADKLIIGAAFYARIWEHVADSNHGLYAKGKFLKAVSFKDFAAYFNSSSGFKYYWDRKAKAPYQYNRQKKLFATFDDERSIAEKIKFINEKKLGGVMFWELTEDKISGGLVDAIGKGLNNSRFK
jgi:chitinase